MNDFDYEVLQRKRLARQAAHKKCGSKSRKCPMPTDYMTKKQWKERCGEVVTYELKKPMEWNDFRKMPPDVQKEYLLALIERYSTTASDLARMFGITPQTVTRFCSSKEIGIEFTRGKRMSKDKQVEFGKFLSHSDGDITNAASEGEAEQSNSEESAERSLPHMDMTGFSLCFEGTINPDMVMNSIISMVRPNENVKLEIRCQILP